MNTSKFLKKNTGMLMLGLLLSFSMSCSKNDNPVTEKPAPVDTVKPPQPSGKIPFYKLQRVENLAVETDDKNPTQAKPAAYFSLDNKEEVPASYAKTARWDVAFTGLYNSFLSGNNGTDGTNQGYGGSGKGGIIVLKKPFEEVTDVPSESDFKTKGNVVGTDDLGAFGEGTGWYLYDFGGTIRGDGSPQKTHVAYALPEMRTIIIRTATGNYAKVKMISCYKDAFTADKWFKDTPHMFFTFEYVLVPKGSTKFEIK
ncbi:hypothetical protein DBR43_01850 [Pedobacter sp. KBW06]|uniref:HmuY family protein n=1 Tax=Pedobacter sp. KBW06 TaxID=2153359 RepID=UPI000F5B3288|nr:HmuY family protein [Pedobacter sp. KBW06]RQO74168.1 hypothetical protein DBR43_01850 [Pedobacter sp. KBW06]